MDSQLRIRNSVFDLQLVESVAAEGQLQNQKLHEDIQLHGDQHPNLALFKGQLYTAYKYVSSDK